VKSIKLLFLKVIILFFHSAENPQDKLYRRTTVDFNDTALLFPKIVQIYLRIFSIDKIMKKSIFLIVWRWMDQFPILQILTSMYDMKQFYLNSEKYVSYFFTIWGIWNNYVQTSQTFYFDYCWYLIQFIRRI